MQEEEAEAVSSGEDAEPAQQAGRRSRSGATLLAQKAAAKGAWWGLAGPCCMA